LIRLIVVAANSVLYWLVLDKQGTIPWLANAVIGIAALYGLYVWFAEPYRRYPILLSSYFTSLSDSALIMVWLYATGSIASPFYLLLYISMVAIAFRYPARQTLFASLVYSGSYFALLLLTGDLSGHWDEAAVRIIYIFLAAALEWEFRASSTRRPPPSSNCRKSSTRKNGPEGRKRRAASGDIDSSRNQCPKSSGLPDRTVDWIT